MESVCVDYLVYITELIMKCPHCEYLDGYYWDNDDNYVKADGAHGDFWTMPIKMERNVGADYYSDGSRKADLIGCPKCKKLFLDDEPPNAEVNLRA